MSALSIQPTYPIFTDRTGNPLENGYIWIGAANLDPHVNPITVYWDAALTQPAGQPIRTLAGYPTNKGTPARLYVGGDYSIRVVEKNGAVVYNAPAATESYNGAVVQIDATNVLFTQYGAGALPRTTQDKMWETVSVADFGATGDGFTNDTVAIQKALDSGAKKVKIGAGTYKVSGQLTVPTDVSVVGEGRDVTIITAEGDTVGTYAATSVLYKGGAAPTAIPNLSVSPGKAARSLMFASAHGLSAGDVILIYDPTDFSFSGSRAEYRGGEYCTVASVVSSVEVDLESCLYAAYTAADVDVYKCAGYCSGSIVGLTVIAPGPGTKGVVRAIAVDYAYKIELEDLGARGSDNASFSISRCYKVAGRSLDCHQWGTSPGFGTQYGLIVSNSQELNLSGHFVGDRHGITYGGGNEFSIPCRAGLVHDFFAKSNTGDVAAADWHGNCEWCVYENGWVFGGGLNIAGNNNRITGIKAFGDNMMLILGREILGCDHVVENIECYTGRNDSTRGIINIGGNESPMNGTITKFGGQFVFRNISINAPNHTRQAIIVRNRGYVGEPFDVIVDNLTYIAPNSNNSSFAAIGIATVVGDACSRVSALSVTTLLSTVTPALALGASDQDCLVRQDTKTGLIEVTTATGVASVSGVVNFEKRFAKTPSVTVNAQFETTSTDRCSALVRSPLATGFTARYLRMDLAGGNFTGVETIPINWTASLNQW